MPISNVRHTPNVVDELRALMQGRGQEPYGEQVTIAEHCLLTAQAASKAGENDQMVVACLLHDVGHWLDEPDDEFGIHSHGELGGDWVAARFGPEISDPVRLHVAAKRYLCGIDSSYLDLLSPASIYTLSKQGGPMGADEIAHFEQLPHHQEAVTLRRLEDSHGKLTGVSIPHLDSFADRLERLAL